jgi:putative transposase
MRELATARSRFGDERLRILLMLEGWYVRRNPVHRLYELEGLKVRIGVRRRKRSRLQREPAPIATRSGRCWERDFVQDQPENGRKFPCWRLWTSGIANAWHCKQNSRSSGMA